MDPLVTSIFNCSWDLGSKFFRWLFDGYFQQKKDFTPLWNETKLYNSIGNKPILLKENHGAYSKTYVFAIPTGKTIGDFISSKAAIAQFLHCSIKDLRIELINNLATITIYDTSKLSFHYKDYKFKDTKELRVPIGISLNDFEPVYWDPTSPNECHLLIGGSTGAGKSVALKVIMEYLVARKDVELYIQDTKIVDLVEYTSRAVIYNEGTNYAVDTLKRLRSEMMDRYEYLKKYELKNMNDCTRKDKPKWIFLVIEELATFNPKTNKDFYQELGELLSKGRAAGINVILTTQAPYAEILPGMLKNNINTILGLKTRTKEASKVISGEYELLTQLRGKGNAFFLQSGQQTEIQVFNI